MKTGRLMALFYVLCKVNFNGEVSRILTAKVVPDLWNEGEIQFDIFLKENPNKFPNWQTTHCNPTYRKYTKVFIKT